MSPWELLQRHPEYVHVVINHVPIEGLAFGALGLFVSLFLKSRTIDTLKHLIMLITTPVSTSNALQFDGLDLAR